MGKFQKNIHFCFTDYAKAFLWLITNCEVPDHLTCLLRNLYVGQEVQVRPLHGTTDWFKIGNGICQGAIL